MPSNNRIILAAAGSGKTTTIVSEALDKKESRSALVTFTTKAESELRAKCYEIGGYVPEHVKPITWFTFLLRHFIRPYQRVMIEKRISGLNFVAGRSAKRVSKHKTIQYNTDGAGKVYSDKISEMACTIINKTKGASLKRAEQIFDRIYIDEVQDLAAYDLDFIELLLGSSIEIVLVGDHRQATYKTNQSARNKQHSGTNIISKLTCWEKTYGASITIHNHSYRCVQPICDFADLFFPDAEPTISRNTHQTDHDGIFIVQEKDVGHYISRYRPQLLRYDKRTVINGAPVYNFGQCKGMTFNRVLIYPHGPLKKYLRTGKLGDAGKSVAKQYVAVTRARQSAAFVVPNTQVSSPIAGVSCFNFDNVSS
ncbi:UvrD-helicase domain-containing protein [Henriciella marina]|uniref:DNA 3'-5' helicase II n=1 Tax=Henriciella marina TaxID=453851 RepID=A0ABT4LWR3_9PROT|nr:UvrD-helicase domain-containing protein [Henriciella marina]MCZ4298809.1 UvrD-helicase domain-containing protein [Henriciella marina]